MSNSSAYVILVLMIIKNKTKRFTVKEVMRKALLIFTCFVMIFAIVFQINRSPALACSTTSECASEINALQAQIDAFTAEATELNNQAATLQTAIAKLENEQAALQVKIDMYQAQYDSLSQQIIETEQKIQTNQDALGKIIADMYVDDNITPIEMLASSGTIGEYLDKQEYRSSVQSQLSDTISQIKDLKQSLVDQKTQVEEVLTDQNNAKNVLVAKKQAQQDLLNETNSQESAYQSLIADARSKIEAAQSSWNAILISSYSDYSQVWNDSNCWMTWADGSPGGYYSNGGSDGNGGDGHGYGCRQCASYAAWRVFKETGYYPEYWGNAINFPASASSRYSEGSTPRAGSLAIMSPSVSGAPEGHVVWVESVNGDGTLTVSQYNANIGGIGYGNFTKVKMRASLFFVYIYIK